MFRHPVVEIRTFIFASWLSDLVTWWQWPFSKRQTVYHCLTQFWLFPFIFGSKILVLSLQQTRKTQKSKWCGSPQTFSHTLQNPNTLRCRSGEEEKTTSDRLRSQQFQHPWRQFSGSSILCQFTYCFVCKICMIFCQQDLRYKQK